MKDEQIQRGLARVMLIGVLVAAGVILAGLAWFLSVNVGTKPGDHIFSGEPKYFESLTAMAQRAFDPTDAGHRRSVAMIGIVLLLLNPLIRVGLAAAGFMAQRDRLYTGISLLVFTVLLFSFFW